MSGLKTILRDAKLEGLTAGKDPTGLAAAAIYISGISMYLSGV